MFAAQDHASFTTIRRGLLWPIKKILADCAHKLEKKEGKKHKTVVKSAFPKLLTQLQQMMNEKDNNITSANLKDGFDKAGLFPVKSARSISRLPRSLQSVEKVNETVSEVVIELLQDLRGFKDSEAGPSKKRKRSAVEPGKSISANDIAPKEQKTAKEKGVGKKTISENKENDIPVDPNNLTLNPTIAESEPSISTKAVKRTANKPKTTIRKGEKIVKSQQLKEKRNKDKKESQIPKIMQPNLILMTLLNKLPIVCM